MQDPQEVPLSGRGFLARLYWQFLGNALVFILLVFVYEKHPRLPSLLDAAYLAAVATLVIVRYVDIRFLNGQTAEGKPATMADWRSYTRLTGALALGAWLLARALAHFMK
jgi:hypothetical protein